MVNSLLNNAVTGLVSSQQNAEEAAQRILNATTARSNISSGLDRASLDRFGQTSSLVSSFGASVNNRPVEDNNAPSNSTGRPALTPLPAEVLSFREDGDLVQSIVDLKISQSAFRASVDVFKRVNEMGETLQQSLASDFDQ